MEVQAELERLATFKGQTINSSVLHGSQQRFPIKVRTFPLATDRSGREAVTKLNALVGATSTTFPHVFYKGVMMKGVKSTPTSTKSLLASRRLCGIADFCAEQCPYL